MTASACALLASFAQIGAWAHSNEVQGWADLLDSPMPKLFVDFSLFFRGLPDDSHPDVVRARHVRLSRIDHSSNRERHPTLDFRRGDRIASRRRIDVVCST
jgi:hypothetical protein